MWLLWFIFVNWTTLLRKDVPIERRNFQGKHTTRPFRVALWLVLDFPVIVIYNTLNNYYCYKYIPYSNTLHYSIHLSYDYYKWNCYFYSTLNATTTQTATLNATILSKLTQRNPYAYVTVDPSYACILCLGQEFCWSNFGSLVTQDDFAWLLNNV